MSAEEEAQAALREAVAASEELQGHLAGIEEQLAMLGGLNQELQRSKLTLESLRDTKPGAEVLLPIGGGNFVRASVAEPGKVISAIGGGVSVEGPVADAVRRVEAQLEAAREAMQRLQEEGQRVVSQMRAIEERVNQLAG